MTTSFFKTVIVRAKQVAKEGNLRVVLRKLIRRPLQFILYKTAWLFPRKNTCIFTSAPDYADNARVLSDWIADRGALEGFQVIWVVGDAFSPPADGAANGIKFVRGLRGCYEICRSRFVFGTHGCSVPSWYRFPDGQCLVNLWHGCSFKASAVSKKTIVFSYVLVPGPLFVHPKALYFRCDERQVLPFGYPRYNKLIEADPTKTARCGALLPKEKINVMWMPTYRKTMSTRYFAEGETGTATGLPLVESASDLKALDSVCSKMGVSLWIKRHRLQQAYSSLSGQDIYSSIVFVDDAWLVSNEVDLYDFIPCFDALITDYSSIGIDYLLVDKPMAFLIDDYEEYKNARGFTVDDPLRYMAGTHCRTMDDLVAFLQQVSFGSDGYAQWREQVREVAAVPCDDYCERLIQFLRENEGFPLARYKEEQRDEKV